MNAVEREVRHLLSHADEMGGWLAAGYANDFPVATAALVARGLWVFTDAGQPHRYMLTDEGWMAAREEVA